MKISRIILGSVFAASFVALPMLANDDSSAMDSSTMTAAVENSSGVMIRVPFDAEGHELTAAAEMRVTGSFDSSTQGALPATWENGVDMTTAPQLDSSTDSDSSTNHSGWNQWSSNNWGWNSNQYNHNSCYNSYRYVQKFRNKRQQSYCI
jgi:hypothetical protein